MPVLLDTKIVKSWFIIDSNGIHQRHRDLQDNRFIQEYARSLDLDLGYLLDF